MRPSRLTSRSVVRVSAGPVVVLGLAVLLPSASAGAAPRAMEAMVRQAACRIETVNEQAGQSGDERRSNQPTVIFAFAPSDTPIDRRTLAPRRCIAPRDVLPHVDGRPLDDEQLALPPPL